MLSISIYIIVLMTVSFFLKCMELLFMIFILGSLLILLMNSVDGLMGVSVYLGFDLMSLLLVLLSVWVSVLMLLVASSTDFKDSGFLFFLVFMMLCMLSFSFMVYNLLGFYLFFEGVLIPILIMIYMGGSQPERISASMYMLMYTLFSSLPLLVILLKFNMFYSMCFIYMGMMSKLICSWVYIFMFIFAFLVKLPMYPMHLWLPKAHVEAPVFGSMMLAGVLLKLGGYGLYRICLIFSYEGLNMYDYILVSISLVGGVYVSFICLCQVDIKSLVAYSSVCHMSLIIGGVFSGSIWGVFGGLILMLGHGLCSSALFCMANMVYERFFTRSLMLLKGLMLIFPFMSFWWFLFSIINMGAPPSMNLLGEIMLMGGLLMWSGLSGLLLVMLSFIGACYSLYLFSLTQHGKVWYFYSVMMLSFREFLLMYAHFYPLVLFILNTNIFTCWVY